MKRREFIAGVGSRAKAQRLGGIAAHRPLSTQPLIAALESSSAALFSKRHLRRWASLTISRGRYSFGLAATIRRKSSKK